MPCRVSVETISDNHPVSWPVSDRQGATVSDPLDPASGPTPGPLPSTQEPVGWNAPAPSPGAFPPRFCFACGAQIDPRAEICPKCGVRQTTAVAVGAGKDRVAAAALALILGGFGVHKFYLGKVAQGVIYLIFFWTGIPALVAWIEAIIYLAKSDEAWAQEYGGAVQRPSSVAIGCLWLLALLPLLALISIVGLLFLGGQVSKILSTVGKSV